MKNINITYGWLLLFGIVVGCSVDKAPAVKKEAPQINSAPYLLAAEPEDGLGVSAARKAVKDQDAVVVIGRIGGSLNPWVDNRVAFQIVDPSLPSCSDCKEGESCSCKTPWDYCCETDKLPDAMALVQFVDEKGDVIKQDARAFFGVTELQTVMVQGVAERDDAGNLTILADKLFVKE